LSEELIDPAADVVEAVIPMAGVVPPVEVIGAVPVTADTPPPPPLPIKVESWPNVIFLFVPVGPIVGSFTSTIWTRSADVA
jgi:hypothetical protein